MRHSGTTVNSNPQLICDRFRNAYSSTCRIQESRSLRLCPRASVELPSSVGFKLLPAVNPRVQLRLVCALVKPHDMVQCGYVVQRTAFDYHFVLCDTGKDRFAELKRCLYADKPAIGRISKKRLSSILAVVLVIESIPHCHCVGRSVLNLPGSLSGFKLHNE
jgi:hypothetical protein